MPGREKSYSHKIYWARTDTRPGAANYRNNKAPVLLPTKKGTSRQESIEQYYKAGLRRDETREQ